MKRLFDFVAALVGGLVLLPLGLLVASAVAFDSGLPVFFRQKRMGQGGRPLQLWKFRTMTVFKAAEQGQFDAGCTSRVTRVGRLLRKTKLDELPQLWNVLRGDMSLVGPRPEIQKWVNAYPERWARVLQVCPGITDPAAIEFRNEEELLAGANDPERMYRDEILPKKLALYEGYIARRSFWGDIGIILKTLWVVVAR